MGENLQASKPGMFREAVDWMRDHPLSTSLVVLAAGLAICLVHEVGEAQRCQPDDTNILVQELDTMAHGMEVMWERRSPTDASQRARDIAPAEESHCDNFSELHIIVPSAAIVAASVPVLAAARLAYHLR